MLNDNSRSWARPRAATAGKNALGNSDTPISTNGNRGWNRTAPLLGAVISLSQSLCKASRSAASGNDQRVTPSSSIGAAAVGSPGKVIKIGNEELGISVTSSCTGH